MSNNATITISGPPGSGTTTLTKGLAARTGAEYINAGAIFRQLAQESGESLVDFSLRAESEEWIDLELDRRMLAHVTAGHGDILEGRLAGWMVQIAALLETDADELGPTTEFFTIFLRADDDIRCTRVQEREGGVTVDVKDLMLKRERSERDRYLRYYGIDIDDMSIYDLVVDTGSTDADACLTLTLDALEEWRQNHADTVA